ncbi:hypothetical protein DM992_15025 [Burkholderia sp. JP2-270]|nr:hypothetical protein DM992_15025 [Burkholderia sp. JP2-270]
MNARTHANVIQRATLPAASVCAGGFAGGAAGLPKLPCHQNRYAIDRSASRPVSKMMNAQ